ncbi:MAG: hypothetical protein F6K30_12540 [Cyanothece sp. SIO2G6]|nr:hypothetical protein [Cyanothece sp. SIO2G6]
MLKSSLAYLHQTLPALGLAVAVVGIFGGAIAPVQAQTSADVDPLEDFQTQDGNSDILGGNGQQGLQDLIHRINLLNDISMEEFVIQRQDNITSEADRFRQLQLDRLDALQLGTPDPDATETSIDLEIDTDTEI